MTTPGEATGRTSVDELVRDAELVARVAVGLGKLSDSTFLTAINKVKEMRATEAIEPAAIVSLQASLSNTIASLAPITLRDLRNGWSPFSESPRTKAAVLSFGVFCILLIGFIAYATQLHGDASQVYQVYEDMQKNRFQEQALRLASDVFKELNSPDTRAQPNELWTDVLSKSLVDILMLDNKLRTVVEEHSTLERRTDIFEQLVEWLGWMASKLTPGTAERDMFSEENPSGNQLIDDYIENYKAQERHLSPQARPSGAVSLVSGPAASGFYVCVDTVDSNGSGEMNVKTEADAGPRVRMAVSLRNSIATLSCLTDILGVDGIDLYRLHGRWIQPFKLKHNIDILGLWLLPGLYGALGAAVYFLRRLVDPTIPNPPWLRVFYRMALGGFAGVIVAWIWNPASGDIAISANANLSTFTLAFIVGYSIDMFFQYLDSIVFRVQQTGTRPAAQPQAPN